MKQQAWIDTEKLPRGFGKRGGLFCPVCKQEASRQIFSEQEMKIGWMHDGRAWPCVRKLGASKEQDASARPMGDTTHTVDRAESQNESEGD